MTESGGVDPEDAGIGGGWFDAGAEGGQAICDGVCCRVDVFFRDDAGPEVACECEPGGIAHPCLDAGFACVVIGPENESERFILIHDGRWFPCPFRVLVQKNLEREFGEVNTGHAVHSAGPRVASPGGIVCLSLLLKNFQRY